MRDWWQELQQMVEGFLDEELDADDPGLAFHLMLAAPLFIGLLLLAHR